MEVLSQGAARVRGGGGVLLDLAWDAFEPQPATAEPAPAPILLLTGWFSDLTLWPPALCAALASHGHRVIRHDPRDAGLSTRLPEGAPVWGLRDLADDAAALMDALGIPAAHIAGLAMGGTVAQLMALRHPHRVRSLTLIGCSTGSGKAPPPEPAVRALNREPLPTDETARRAHRRKCFEAMAGGCFDEPAYLHAEAQSLARGSITANAERQLLAIVAAGDRTGALAAVHQPALVIAGRHDPLVAAEAAVELTRALPQARLLVIEGMGHGHIPGSCCEELAAEMAHHAHAS